MTFRHFFFLLILLSVLVIQDVLSCNVGDIYYTKGESMGLVALACINETAYFAQSSICSENLTIVATNDSSPVLQITCPPSLPFCARGFRRNAMCLPAPNPCCEPQDGPGGCPDADGSFSNCWDEGGFCCMDGKWYGDHGDGSNNCQDNFLGDGVVCDCASFDCCKYVGGTIDAGMCSYATADGRTLDFPSAASAGFPASLYVGFIFTFCVMSLAL